MVVSKLCWLLLEMILLVLFAWFGSSAALGLGIALVLIPLFSVVVNLSVRKKLDISMDGAVNQRKKETGEVCITLHNPTVFPVMRVRCKMVARNLLNGEIQVFTADTALPMKGNTPLKIQVGSSYCGRIKICTPSIRLYDCFGLIGIICKSDVRIHTTVQPDTFETNVTLHPNAHSYGESDVYAQDRPGDDLTETYQIREYVPGDSPRQVHWKLSSKFDRLIVRDPALPITRNVLVFWERTGQSEDRELTDAQAEIIVSLCQNLLEQAIPFTIGWNDTDRNLCVLYEIGDLETFVSVIPRLMSAAGKKDGISGADLLVRTRPDALCGHMLYLAQTVQSEVMQMQQFGSVTVLTCGNLVACDGITFDATNYSRQLSKIDV